MYHLGLFNNVGREKVRREKMDSVRTREERREKKRHRWKVSKEKLH